MDFDFNYEVLGELRDRLEAKDLLLMISVPLVTGFIFLLPDGAQQALTLSFEDPSLLNFLTTAYVHNGFSHLFNNMGFYLLLMFSIYSMAALSDMKKEFRRFFFLFVLILPFPISGISLHFLEVEGTTGFSGVASAFLGFLPVVIFRYLDEKFELELPQSNSLWLFLTGLAILTVIYQGLSNLFLGILALVVLYTWLMWREIDLEALKQATGEKGYFDLFLTSLLMFLAMTVLTFPKNIIFNGTAVNILSHYSGYALGFFVPYAWMQMNRVV